MSRAARLLLERAAAVLPGLSAPDRAAPLESIRRFVDHPRPSRLLAASNALALAARTAAAARTAPRRRERSFERLAADGLSPPFLEALATLPRDAITVLRLEALAALADTHQELSARANAATAALRARLQGRKR